ncbi:MAG: PilZ domain-containing protein [Desulfobacterales bacterium]
MVSTPEHRKSIRYEHKSTVMLSDEHSEYFSYAQMFNFSGGGLYFKSDVFYKQGTKIRIQFDNPPFQYGPKTLSSVVRWSRELPDDDPDYTFGVGVKFI